MTQLVKDYESESEALTDALIALSVYGEVPYDTVFSLTPYEFKRFEKILKEKAERVAGKKPTQQLALLIK